MVTFPSNLPYYTRDSVASYGGQAQYQNLHFNNFLTSTTFCGADQRIFRLNPKSPDYTPRSKLNGTTFNNVGQDAMFYIFSPPWSWAGLSDCGKYPCTGPNNTYMSFKNTKYTGTTVPIRTDSQFQIVPYNAQESANLTGCDPVDNWNAFYCQNQNLGILLFESLDSDKWTRTITPITVSSYNITSTTSLNTFMDHVWDGFYTGELRLSRYPALVQTSSNNGAYYEVKYSGTPPSSQRFRLNADSGAITVKIQYAKAGAYVVNDAHGNTITANAWDNTLGLPGLIKGDNGGFCGENRYQGLSNILEFYIRPDCGDIYIQPVNSLVAAVRMNWTLDGFYSAGGTTQFIDNLATVLGIHAANIKVVSVYTGSVVVQFQIIDNTQYPLNATSSKDLTTIQQVLSQKLASKTINLGAPIIGANI